MLVCTPSPKSTESLFGYILRISEINGYDTPRLVLNYAGYGSGEMRSAVFDVNHLAKVLGRKSTELNRITYSVAKRNGSRDFKILNHKLVNSKKLPKGFLRLTKPMMCPQCVKDDGAIDIFWDLHFAVACPVHSVRTLRQCPKCKKNINWFRPGLLKCSCGEYLTNNSTLFPVGAKMVTLMTIIKEKLYSHSIKKLENSSKFPINELNKISFFSLNWLIEVLGKYNLYSKSLPKTKNPHLIVMEAADVLSDWPNRYHTFLTRLGTRFSEGRGYKTTGLRGQFQKFYLSIFKSKSLDKADSKFLRDEFLNFGFEHWGKAIVDNKLLKNTNLIDKEIRFQNKSKVANELGISPKTLKNWLEKGWVPCEQVVTADQVKYILDKKSLNLVKKISGKTLLNRDAAAFLQIPVSDSAEDLNPACVDDGREIWEWESKYPIAARKEITFEAWYLAVMFVISLLIIYIGQLEGTLSLLGLANIEGKAIFYAIAFSGGLLGGTLFGMKWLYHSVVRGRWHIDRRLWRVNTPWISAAVGLMLVLFMDSGLIESDVQIWSSEKSFVMGFTAGYFSDSALGKFSEIAQIIFGRTTPNK